VVEKVVTDPSRDALLTEFGKTTLTDRYLLPGESYQDMFARVATAFADDIGHAQRIYDYISKLWFMPATPVLSNGGAERGLPISCFLNAVGDSLDGIMDTWNENVWLASNGGGIGTYWGGVRSIGEKVGQNGDGLADARDQPRFAAPRFGGGVLGHPPPGDRGIPRNPQTSWRLQPQEFEPAPRAQPHRRVHDRRAR
jgi:hypothetical protein